MATKNIYSEVVESYNRLCNKVCDILNVSWNYWSKLKEKIANIYDTEVDDESECLTDSASKYLGNLYSEEDDDATVLFEKLGFKDLVDDDCYLDGNWSNIRDDFAITIVSTSQNYIKVKLYSLCDEGNTASLKIPVKYLQSETYKELLRAKYEAIDKEIDKRTKKKSDKNKSNKVKEFISPRIELKEKLIEFIGDKPFDSEKEACEVVETFAKKYSTSFKERYINCQCENGMIAVAYNDSDNNSVKMFMIPVSIVER